MLKLTPDIASFNAAGLVSKSAQLITVRFQKIEARKLTNAFSQEQAPFTTELKFGFRDSSILENRLLVCTFLTLGIKAPKKDKPESESKEDLASFSLEIVAEYAIPSEPMPEFIKETGLPAFVRINPIYQCWPYYRAELQHLTVNLDLPPYVLPPLVVKPKDTKSKAQPSSKKAIPLKEVKPRKTLP